MTTMGYYSYNRLCTVDLQCTCNRACRAEVNIFKAGLKIFILALKLMVLQSAILVASALY